MPLNGGSTLDHLARLLATNFTSAIMDTGGPMDGLTADQCHGYASRSDGSLVRSAPRQMTASSVLASCHKRNLGFLHWLLPARRQRPHGCTAKEGDEFAPFHCPVPSASDGKDSTELLHCRISIWPMSASGQNRSLR